MQSWHKEIQVDFDYTIKDISHVPNKWKKKKIETIIWRVTS